MCLGSPAALDFAPGGRWVYRSSEFAALGRVIELAFGQRYETFMQQHVFELLEMRDSSFFTKARRMRNSVSTAVRDTSA